MGVNSPRIARSALRAQIRLARGCMFAVLADTEPDDVTGTEPTSSRPLAAHAACVGVVEKRRFLKAARPIGGHRASGGAPPSDAKNVVPDAPGRIAERVILGIGAATSRRLGERGCHH